MKKRVALYVRVSTIEQSTELQVRELKSYVESRGWNITELYEDRLTGTNGNRPSLKKMMLDARERKFDVVACWKLDRLFRSLKNLLHTLQEFDELGLEFVSLKDHIDLTTSAGRLMTHLLAAFGEFEASLIRERVRSGLANARAKGTRLGRPMKRDDAKIRELRLKGRSMGEIAAELGIAKATVHTALSNRSENPLKLAT